MQLPWPSRRRLPSTLNRLIMNTGEQKMGPDIKQVVGTEIETEADGRYVSSCAIRTLAAEFPTTAQLEKKRRHRTKASVESRNDLVRISHVKQRHRGRRRLEVSR
jgi:hypothetical protein